MYGYTPEHAASSQMAFMVYFGSPMVAKFDKEKGVFVKATDAYLWDKFFLVVRSFAFLGLLYSVFLTFPETFPQFGIEYDEAEWYSLGHLFSRTNFKNSFLYAGMSATLLLAISISIHLYFLILPSFCWTGTPSSSYQLFFSSLWQRVVTVVTSSHH
jgi:uncharacterized membrane protein